MQYLDYQAVNDFFNPAYEKETEAEVIVRDYRIERLYTDVEVCPKIVEMADHLLRKNEPFAYEVSRMMYVRYNEHIEEWYIQISNTILIYCEFVTLMTGERIAIKETEFIAACFIESELEKMTS